MQHPKINPGSTPVNPIMTDISEACKVQVDRLEDSEPDSYKKNDMKEKANSCLGCKKQCKKN